MMRKRNEKISISLDPEVLYRIEEELVKENRSRSNYIETILRKHLDEKPGARRYTVDEKASQTWR